jgi:tetratricopeptide (TPR) repeat protein
MRAFVFTDPALASRAGQFVWLAVNTDLPRNAHFEDRFTLDAWPTFYVVRAADESVALRWVGGMTIGQVQTFLDDSILVLAGKTPTSAAAVAAARADRLYAEGENGQAAEAYRQVLEAAPPDWPGYARTVESLLFAYMASDAPGPCVALAREALPRVGGTASVVNVSVSGLACALDLEKDDPDRGGAVAEMETAVRRTLDDPETGASADDRSSGFGYLVQAREDAGDAVGARAVAEEWATFLEAQAAAAQTPEQRAVFDSHRLRAYLALGQPEKAIRMLEAAERELPEDDNPPARLAYTYQKMERWDEALAASRRAVARAAGPRRVRLLQRQADIHAAKGDARSARKALAMALEEAEALPEGELREELVKTLREKLDVAS